MCRLRGCSPLSSLFRIFFTFLGDCGDSTSDLGREEYSAGQNTAAWTSAECGTMQTETETADPHLPEN